MNFLHLIINLKIMIAFLIQQTSLRDIPGLITNSYIFAAVFSVLMIGLTSLICKLIPTDTSVNRKDPKSRRIVFWLFSAITPVLFYLYNFIMVIPNIKKGPAYSAFFIHGALSAVSSLVLYLIIGFALSKIFKNTILGHWFPSKNK